MPARKFTEQGGMRLPESVFIQSVTGDYIDDTWRKVMNPADIDMVAKPDPDTLRVVPWAERTHGCCVIHDCFYPRTARRVDHGAAAGAAPDAWACSTRSAAGCPWWRRRSSSTWSSRNIGRRLSAGAAHRPLRPRRDCPPALQHRDAVDEFEPLSSRTSTTTVSVQRPRTIDNLIHESGTAQLEINLQHGDAAGPRRPDVPVQAHRSREAAHAPRDLRDLHGEAPWRTSRAARCTGTSEPAAQRRGQNASSAIRDGAVGDLFFAHFIGGLQKYLAATTTHVPAPPT
ncbi:MAG: hypothetical protein MZV49_04950 [Rhodopseudomonas palustris]|nr:hypothetical protein [Rhodopseudomonas palustris]